MILKVFITFNPTSISNRNFVIISRDFLIFDCSESKIVYELQLDEQENF